MRDSIAWRRVKAIGASIVMYLVFATVWLLIGVFLFTGWALWTSGVATNSPVVSDPEPLSWLGSVLVTAVALVTAVLAGRGFIALSRRWRLRTRKLWLEARDPTWVETHGRRRIDRDTLEAMLDARSGERSAE